MFTLYAEATFLSHYYHHLSSNVTTFDVPLLKSLLTNSSDSALFKSLSYLSVLVKARCSERVTHSLPGH